MRIKFDGHVPLSRHSDPFAIIFYTSIWGGIMLFLIEKNVSTCEINKEVGHILEYIDNGIVV